MVKRDMARMNTDILEISEIKWTGMGKFNSDGHHIYYCGQQSLKRNGVVLIDSKTVQNAVFGFNLRNNRMILVCFQSKQYDIMVIQVCAPTEEAEVEQLTCSIKTYKTF